RGVQQRGEQVVAGAHRVDVAGEVQVEVLHRHHLRQAAAGCPSLDAEHGAERGLAQAEQRIPADRAHSLSERYRRGGLALARPGGSDAGYADELAVRDVVHAVEDAQRHLRLVAAVGLELLGQQAASLGDRFDRLELGVLSDLQARLTQLPYLLVSYSPPPRP